MKSLTTLGLMLALSVPATAIAFATPTDPQIAHIAYTAGEIDVSVGKLAITKARSPAVRAFAEEMVRDHSAVNDQALALVRRLGVRPQDNPTSQGLVQAARVERAKLERLSGAAFDRAYVANETAYHRTVNGALSDVLIPNANNGELKSLLQTGLKLFSEHQAHAEHLAGQIK